ncbi:MAG: hypothetical protein KAT00_15165, partial [Planctomycetes bacterium]|nr:hypothetical protein [Planctomycetota bacterium]
MEHAVDTFNCKAENCSRREPRACDSHNTLGIFLDEQGKCVHYEKVRRIDFEEMAQREKQCILLSKLIALSRKD